VSPKVPTEPCEYVIPDADVIVAEENLAVLAVVAPIGPGAAKVAFTNASTVALVVSPPLTTGSTFVLGTIVPATGNADIFTSAIVMNFQ
jgi:hypothetical protein